MITNENGDPRNEPGPENPLGLEFYGPDGRCNYWLSWYHGPRMGAFAMGFPWWETGRRIRMVMGALSQNGEATPVQIEDITICAGLRARDDQDAKMIVRMAYESYPAIMEWRFCERRPIDWEPFNGRFPRAAWMVWPNPLPEDKTS